MGDTQTITRKIQLYPVGDKEEIDRVYKYIREGMYNQNKAYNILISNLYAAIYAGKTQEEINEILKKGKRNQKKMIVNILFINLERFSFPRGYQRQAVLE